MPSYLVSAGEHDGADRHVDADAEGVGAADDLEQPGLGELLDQPAVLRQHPGVVDADAVPDQPGELLAEAGANRKPPISSAIWSRSSRVETLMLVSAWARSSAAAWVKWTT